MNQALSGFFRADGHLRKLVKGCIQDFVNTHTEINKANADSLARRIVGQIKGVVLHAKDAQEFCCYHVTTRDRLESILKNGLVPNSEPNWFTSKTPYVMLSLYPYWGLYGNPILLEIKDPAILPEYFDDAEGLRWGKVIEPQFIQAVVEFKLLKSNWQNPKKEVESNIEL